jgi:REP element-mobilizing transposase RayT
MSNEKYLNKYRIPSARLQGYDYGANGVYFVTICTQKRIHYFGEIVPVETDDNPSLSNADCHPPSNADCHPPSNADCHQSSNANRETDYYPSLRATEIGKIAHNYWIAIPDHFPFVALDEFVIMPDHIHGILFFNKPDKQDWAANTFGRQSRNLGSVLRGFKASVKRFANENKIEFGWQTRYYDRIIRDEDELSRIRLYINNNQTNWLKGDCPKITG